MAKNIESLRFNFGASSNIENADENLRSQNATSSSVQYEGRRYLPYVFTEQGITMLSGILKNKVAVHVSIGIMNANVDLSRDLYAFDFGVYEFAKRFVYHIGVPALGNQLATKFIKGAYD